MPTTLFAAASLFAPIQSFLRRLPEVSFRRRTGAPLSAPCPIVARPNAGYARRTSPGSAPAGPIRCAPTLRVLRVMEAGQPAAHGGRMVISGRMADVCAELDRMAAREAALQS